MRQLFILAFDHRTTFAERLLGFSYGRLAPKKREQVTALKEIVFKGFLEARRKSKDAKHLAILIDEEFGTSIISLAKKLGISLAVPVEKSGQKIFTLEFGKKFGLHLKKIKPNFAKVLIRYDVAKKKDNRFQRSRLKIVSDFCKKQKLNLIIEVLLTGRGSKLKQLTSMIKEMQEADIRPTLWKLEGLQSANAWKKASQQTKASLLMLGRGASKTQVSSWVKTAAKSGVVNGFAIGRTIFFDPLKAYLNKKITVPTASRQIANNFLYFLNLWNQNSL
ncbi:DUF2090 domain-containing protein [Candidatus Uhrbacteria bacterium]|nr:DUF2090 domain-containing protein [Candidatus Uhrbacteria bacterium]